MFCFQCQETAKGTGCTIKGVCGKSDDVAQLQDVLIYVCKGISLYSVPAREKGIDRRDINQFIADALFTTITNANFDKLAIAEKIKHGLFLREDLRKELKDKNIMMPAELHDAATWTGSTLEEYLQKAPSIGVLSTTNEDIRSLRELLIYGIKGIAAYGEHAANLGFEDQEIWNFMQKGLAASTDETLGVPELLSLVMECGSFGVKVMALLDKANTTKYGNPEITKVNIGVRNNPGILISGHDLTDMEALLELTK
jgi:hydroxylamine reductase